MFKSFLLTVSSTPRCAERFLLLVNKQSAENERLLRSSKYFNDFYPELVKFQNDRIKLRNQSDPDCNLPLGSEVLIFKPSLSDSGKIGSFWDGPLIVIRKTNDQSYLLKCKKTRRLFRRHRRHIRRLIPNSLNPPQNNFSFEQSDKNNSEIIKENLSILHDLPRYYDPDITGNVPYRLSPT